MSEKKQQTFIEKLGSLFIWSIIFAVFSYVLGIIASKYLYGTDWVLYSEDVIFTSCISFGLLLLFYLLKDRKEDSAFKGAGFFFLEFFGSGVNIWNLTFAG